MGFVLEENCQEICFPDFSSDSLLCRLTKASRGLKHVFLLPGSSWILQTSWINQKNTWCSRWRYEKLFMFSRNTTSFVKLIYKTRSCKNCRQFNSLLIEPDDKICIIWYYIAFFFPDRIWIIQDIFFNCKPLSMTQSNLFILKCIILQTKSGDIVLCTCKR